MNTDYKYENTQDGSVQPGTSNMSKKVSHWILTL